MHDLQLVGFTTDRRGLILRSVDGARRENFVVPVTAELVAAITELAEAEVEPDEEAVVAQPVEPVEPRPTSQLSVRDIQARLRAGEPTRRVAAEAGVDEEWIERFAPPVRAEQRRIVEQALECHLQRSRSGPSAVPLRRAVGMAMADKGIAFTVAAFDAGWSSHLLGHDRWAVEFTYRHRGKDRTAGWVFDAATGELTTADRTASQLGYVAGDAGPDDDAGTEVDGIIGDPDAKTQIGTATDPATAQARKKATARRQPARTRGPAAKKTSSTSEKKSASKKKAASKKKVAPKKAAPKKAAPKKKKAASKRAAPAKTSPAKKSAAKKTSSTKKSVTKKSVTKKSSPAKKAGTAKTSVPKKVATKKVAPTKKLATKKAAPVAKAPVARTPAAPAPTAPVSEPVAPPPAPPATRAPEGPPPGSPPVEAARVPSPAGTDGPPPRPAVAARPGAVRLDEVPLAPAGNGRTRPRPDAPAPGRPPELERIPDAPGIATPPVDRTGQRRARAAQRNAPTVQFRSGSAAPVRAPGEDPPRPASRPAPEAPGGSAPVDADGAARPRSRRRRQLRAT
jgi:chemotaxis protein histidine kinase CheA